MSETDILQRQINELYKRFDRMNSQQSPGAWSDYTVTWTQSTTNPTLGNGVLLGQYFRSGKTITATITLVIGSTTVLGTGNFEFTLPFAVDTKSSSSMFHVGTGYVYDQSAAKPYVFAVRLPRTATKADTFFVDSSTGIRITQALPMTWASGDQMAFSAVYEAA